MTRVTPINIQDLPIGSVFVFGSNESGEHVGGAARQAVGQLGAKWGQGFGRAGETFAIPTLDWQLRRLPLKFIELYVKRFLAYAKRNPKGTFLVTAIGCGIAGRRPEQIAPMFKAAKYINNIQLPREFWEVINKKKRKK